MQVIDEQTDPRRELNKRRDLRERFMRLQQAMVAQLENHEDEEHGETKGSAHEDEWRDTLRDYLPKRYCVDKAFVIDSDGYISEQIDAVVYDQQYSPFIFREKGRTYVPAESVYAVLEIKQALNVENVRYAGKKAASVRRLYRTSSTIYHAAGEHPPKPPGEILAGILTLRSEWSPPLGAALERALEEADALERLDIGCALKHGAFRATYEEGFAMSRSAEEEAFITFFLKLLLALQRLGTVPAMDLRAYAAALESF